MGLYDVIETKTQLFLVMELILGPSLGDYLKMHAHQPGEKVVA